MLINRRNIIYALLVLAFLFLGWKLLPSGSTDPHFRLAAAKHTDLLVTVSATGTVEPEEVIDVGAQVAGQILSFGKDQNGKTIDYGSVVDQGMVLAQIDDALYRSDASQAEAELNRAKADLVQLKAKLIQAEADWNRAKQLGPSDALSQSSFDGYRAGFEVAKANVLVGDASIVQAQAMLDKARRNLGFCTIASPVKGVIIDRRVNIGQTVVSSLNAPSLFLLAKDLTRIQVWVAVNEADIGSIHPDQPVKFTVDAYPNKTFEGKVGKIRLNATMAQNVVSYTVEVIADNSDGKLLPYLTANVQFEITKRENVLTVPNVALRWTPSVEQVESKYKERVALLAQPQTQKNTSLEKKPKGDPRKESHTVWVLENKYVRPIDLQIGASDGIFTEVTQGELIEGEEVVLGEEDPTNTSPGQNQTSNPFTPRMPRH